MVAEVEDADFERQQNMSDSSSSYDKDDSSKSEKSSARRSRSQMVQINDKLQQIRMITVN